MAVFRSVVGTIIARLAVRQGDVWVTLVKTDTPYFSRRNRDLGTISVYGIWAIVTSAVYPHTCTYVVSIHIVSSN